MSDALRKALDRIEKAARSVRNRVLVDEEIGVIRAALEAPDALRVFAEFVNSACASGEIPEPETLAYMAQRALATPQAAIGAEPPALRDIGGVGLEARYHPSWKIARELASLNLGDTLKAQVDDIVSRILLSFCDDAAPGIEVPVPSSDLSATILALRSLGHLTEDGEKLLRAALAHRS